MDKETINLIKLAITGDKKAVTELIKKEQNKIYTTILYLKKDNIDIADILQIVLIKLANNITKLKNPLSYKTWINSIIVNTYYDYLRKNRINFKITSTDDTNSNSYSINEIPDYRENPQDNLIQSEIKNIIKKIVELLPIHYKIPIKLREYDGMSYKQIALLINKSEGTVKSRIARAREIIKSELIKYNNDY